TIAAHQSARVAVFMRKSQQLAAVRPFKPSQADSSNLAPDAFENLLAPGYVAYRSPVSAEALAAGLADPKNKLEEFNTILDAQNAMRAGDTARGEALFARVQEQDPNMYVVHFSLGEAAARK